MMEGSGAESVLGTSRSGCGSGRAKTYGSYGSANPDLSKTATKGSYAWV
jgi:hypothetical protein